ncbi:DUF6153 family protein [Agreia sp. COWG]|uniref:DUF6153 family protein n=1 Tax=Agreia sp. COWG TaxID=2773266 RepID=UPI0019260414|nr:DUF6153 family protein [Agreia sp. COWG]
MNLIDVRSTLLQRDAVKRTLLLVGLVLTVMAGLIAMHTIASTTMAHSAPSTAAMVMPSDGHAAPSDVQGDEGCTGDCAPSHDVMAMACVLAVAFGGVVFVIGLVRSAGLRAQLAEELISDRSFLPESFPFRAPPDLLKLSISRT